MSSSPKKSWFAGTLRSCGETISLAVEGDSAKIAGVGALGAGICGALTGAFASALSFGLIGGVGAAALVGAVVGVPTGAALGWAGAELAGVLGRGLVKTSEIIDGMTGGKSFFERLSRTRELNANTPSPSSPSSTICS